ncbi:MAG: hypothetical protein FWE59_06820, partial [Oscillospiraceae bacterium]|nr:hypothetical protein [Oscillospiraceae bacterium]
MLEVAILKVIPELTQGQFDALLALAPAEKQEAIRRRRVFRDARNTLLGDFLARSEIRRVLGIDCAGVP